MHMHATFVVFCACGRAEPLPSCVLLYQQSAACGPLRVGECTLLERRGSAVRRKVTCHSHASTWPPHGLKPPRTHVLHDRAIEYGQLWPFVAPSWACQFVAPSTTRRCTFRLSVLRTPLSGGESPPPPPWSGATYSEGHDVANEPARLFTARDAQGHVAGQQR